MLTRLDRPHSVPRALALALFFLAAAPRLHAQIAVLSDLVQEQEAAPGGTYAGVILVKNVTDKPQGVRLHQTDYAFRADGQTRYDAPGAVARSNAAWVTFSPASLELLPGETAVVRYTVRVPGADSLAGTYWSVLMVESADGPAMAAAPQQFALVPRLRYAVQVATHLVAVGTRAAEFSAPRLAAEGAERTLEVDVTNSGERAVRPRMSLELYDESGTLAGRLEQARGLLYPQSSIRQRFALPALPPGSYRALLVAELGDDEVVATSFKLRP